MYRVTQKKANITSIHLTLWDFSVNDLAEVLLLILDKQAWAELSKAKLRVKLRRDINQKI